MSFVLDASVRHAVFMQRYAAGRAREAREQVFTLRDELLAVIAVNAAKINAGNVEDIDKAVGKFNDDFKNKISADAMALVDSEIDFNAAMLSAATIGVAVLKPTIEKTFNDAYSKGMAVNESVNKIIIPTAIDQFLEKNRQAIRLSVSDSVLAGQSASDNVKDILTHRQPAKASSLVRTIATAVSNSTKQTLFQTNTDFVEGVEFIAVLDSHTTVVCSGNDSKVFQIDSAPVPPLHWGACVEGTMIATDKGDIPIEHVKVGDYVLTHTGNWEPVTAVMGKDYSGNLCTLKNDFGSVRLTPDHPVLTDIGYQVAGKINTGASLFNYRNKLKWPKDWFFGSMVINAVLINSHNIKTKVVEILVAYTVTSITRGVSASIKLDNACADQEVGNITANNFLILKIKSIKVIFKKLLVKCKGLLHSHG